MEAQFCARCTSETPCSCTEPFLFQSAAHYAHWYHTIYTPQAFQRQAHQQDVQSGQSTIPFPSHTDNALRPALAGLNTSHPTSQQGRTRPAPTPSNASANPRPRKRANNGSSRSAAQTAHHQSTTTTPAVPGVGPINENNPPSRPFSPGTSTHFESIIRPKKATHESANKATHIWYFVRGLSTANRPDSLPSHEEPSQDRPSPKQYPFLGCKLCCGDEWTTWKNGNSPTSTIENHLKKHGNVWRLSVHQLRLKGWQTILLPEDHATNFDDNEPNSEQPAFSIRGFYERLARWIAVDDQSVHVVDSPELRDLLLYVGQGNLVDKDLPHRTKLTDIILDEFRREYSAMLERVKNSVGRVSFTSDIWSAQNLQSYMAITAHYIMRDAKTGRLVLRSDLVAFRALEESHTGAHLSAQFIDVLKEIQCLSKIGLITLDNASNNNTLMRDMSTELEKLDIPFSVEGNRIRCFPHVVNIAVKTGLKHCTTLPEDDDITPAVFADTLDESSELHADPAYALALSADAVAAARRLVNACRASDGRRKELQKVIAEGNGSGGWPLASSDGTPLDPAEREAIAVLQLIRDVDTRWSSTFLMIDRLLMLYLPVYKMAKDDDNLVDLTLTEAQISVLTDIREFLSYCHSVQELVSAEHTPTLSIVIPLYEQLILKLHTAIQDLPKLHHVITASIEKLEEYLSYSRKAKVYNLAIVINPMMKFEWIKKHWSSTDYDDARTHVRNTMLEFRRDERRRQHQTPLPDAATSMSTPIRRTVTVSAVPSATKAQKSGMARFLGMGRSATAPAIQSSDTRSESSDLEDERYVDDEIRRFEAEGLIGPDGLPPGASVDEFNRAIEEAENLDLLRYWEERRVKFNLLFRIAMDVLPAQASAVPCERVFSSSKETDTARRNSLSPTMMEILQFLKFTYRHDRLSFFGNLVCTESELTIIDVPPDTIAHCIAHGDIATLKSLINNVSDSVTTFTTDLSS